MVDPVSDTEVQALLALPATAVNKFMISMAPQTVRLTFAEQNGTNVALRCAVSIARGDAAALADCLNKMLAGEELLSPAPQNVVPMTRN